MKKYIKYILFSILLFLAIKNLEIHKLMDSLSLVRIDYIAIVLILQLFTILLTSLQWYFLINLHGEKASYLSSLCMNSLGNIIDFITPGVKVGGDYKRLVDLKSRLDIDFYRAVSILASQKLISGISFLIFVLYSLFWAFRYKISLNFNKIILLIFSLMLLILICGKLVSKYIKEKKVRLLIKNIREGIDFFRDRKKDFIFNLPIGMLIWILYPFKLYIIVRAAGYRLSFPLIISISYLSYLLGALPLSVGGFGAFESSLIILLKTFKIPVEASILIAFLFKLTNLFFEFILSSLIVLGEKTWKVFRKGDSFGKIKV